MLPKPSLSKSLKGFLLKLRGMIHFQALKAEQSKIVIFFRLTADGPIP